MNLDPTPLTDDELSAALDGDDALAERAASIPESNARLAALAQARQLVADGSPPELDASVVDGLIANAIDAPLAPSAPSRRRQAPPGWLVAAVVVLLAAIGLTLVFTGRGSSDEQLATSGEATADEAFDTVSGQVEDRAAEGEGTPESLQSNEAPTFDDDIGEVTYVGAFATAADLRSALATDFPVGATATSTDAPPAPNASAIKRCADQLTVTLSLEDGPTRTGYGDVDEKSVVVYEFAATSAADGQPTTLVAAVGVDACDEVTIFER